jgi:hypothetical protein
VNVLYRFVDSYVVKIDGHDDAPLVREFDGRRFVLVGIENGTAFYNEIV